MLLLELVKPERLRNYLDHITHFCSLYGPQCWPIIYQADCRMRCEHFERIRRQLESHHAYYVKAGTLSAPPGFTFDPAAPWDAVFGAASRDEPFWTAEVKDKCILFLARLAPAGSLLSAGTTLDPPANLSGASGHPGGKQQPQQQQAGRKGRRNGSQRPPAQEAAEGYGKGAGSHASPSKGGNKGAGKPPGKRKNTANETSDLYNAGKCQENPCPRGRKHICAKCGGSHPAAHCQM